MRVRIQLKILLLIFLLMVGIIEDEVFDVSTCELGSVYPGSSCTAALFLARCWHLILLRQSGFSFSLKSRQDCFLLICVLQDTFVVVSMLALPWLLLLVILIVLLEKRSDCLEMTLRRDGRQLWRSIRIEKNMATFAVGVVSHDVEHGHGFKLLVNIVAFFVQSEVVN